MPAASLRLRTPAGAASPRACSKRPSMRRARAPARSTHGLARRSARASTRWATKCALPSADPRPPLARRVPATGCSISTRWRVRGCRRRVWRASTAASSALTQTSASPPLRAIARKCAWLLLSASLRTPTPASSSPPLHPYMTLGWILVASFAGGTLSCALAAFALFVRASWIPMLVSYAIGALLGAAFLEVIPHAFEKGPPREAAISILAGIFAFFVLEKLLLWRHCHTENCEVHDRHEHEHSRSGVLIILGDTVQNFVDGVLIAAAFLQSTELGIIAAVAIIAHEIPQDVGDFLILLHSGYSHARALAMNLLSSCATLLGGVGGYYGLKYFHQGETALLGVVAASMIYVAVADLIPGLHRRPELRDTASQALLIALGIGSIAAVRLLLAH